MISEDVELNDFPPTYDESQKLQTEGNNGKNNQSTSQSLLGGFFFGRKSMLIYKDIETVTVVQQNAYLVRLANMAKSSLHHKKPRVSGYLCGNLMSYNHENEGENSESDNRIKAEDLDDYNNGWPLVNALKALVETMQKVPYETKQQHKFLDEAIKIIRSHMLSDYITSRSTMQLKDENKDCYKVKFAMSLFNDIERVFNYPSFPLKPGTDENGYFYVKAAINELEGFAEGQYAVGRDASDYEAPKSWFSLPSFGGSKEEE